MINELVVERIVNTFGVPIFGKSGVCRGNHLTLSASISNACLFLLGHIVFLEIKHLDECYHLLVFIQSYLFVILIRRDKKIDCTSKRAIQVASYTSHSSQHTESSYYGPGANACSSLLERVSRAVARQRRVVA